MAVPRGEPFSRTLGHRIMAPVATTAALTAISQELRPDGAMCAVTGDPSLWQYSFSSTATASADVLAPDAGVGRWHRVSQGAAGGASTIACRGRSAGALAAYTRTANVILADAVGALGAQDGVTYVAGQLFFLHPDDAAAGADAGVYTIDVVGDGSTAYQMTRAPGADAGAEFPGLLITVEEGTTHADTAWQVTNNSVTLNTTAITCLQVSYDLPTMQAADTSLTTRISNDECDLSDAESSLDSHETRLTSADTRLTSGDTRLTSADTRFTSADTRISGDECDLSDAESSLDSHETRLTSADTRLTSADTRLTSADTRISGDECDLSDAESSLDSHETRLTSADTRLTSADTRLTSADTRISGDECDLSDAESSLDSHETRLTSADTRFTSADTRISGDECDLSDAESSLASHETRLGSADTRLTSADTRLTSADTRISGDECDLSDAESSLDSHETRFTSADTRISGDECDLSDAESSVDSIQTRLSLEESNRSDADSSLDLRVDVLDTGTICFFLQEFREVDANGDVGNLAAHGGILAADSTPILRGGTNEDTEISWAVGNTDIISTNCSLPEDLNAGSDITIRMWVSSGAGGPDPATFTVNCSFDQSVQVSDTCTDGAPGAARHEITGTIANGDIPAGADTLTMQLVPAAHANDAIQLHGIRLEYARA